MGISREVSVVVLEDDQIAIASQTGTYIDHTTIGRGQHRVAGTAANINALVLDFIKSPYQRPIGRPQPVDLIIARCGLGRFGSSWAAGWAAGRTADNCAGRQSRGRLARRLLGDWRGQWCCRLVWSRCGCRGRRSARARAGADG